jgi:hypothetical protein
VSFNDLSGVIGGQFFVAGMERRLPPVHTEKPVEKVAGLAVPQSLTPRLVLHPHAWPFVVSEITSPTGRTRATSAQALGEGSGARLPTHCGAHHCAPPMCSAFLEKNLPSLRQTPARLLNFLEQNGTGL